MTTTTSTIIIEYAKTTQNTCLWFSIASLLIVLFILTPLNKFVLSSNIGKIIILIILGYLLYNSLKQTTNFSNSFNISLMNGPWNLIKTNVACSYIFDIFLIFLILSVIRKMF